eukprot:TRINITY_DN42289_c0_g1_i1.p1 TRINITY_DN42289_c0_g1~~TRINITY_DN42289_c0_g1_i1.p1  ORF type:complete len:462 (+),score=147.26 TRINITY_DN42289_c0_g1_i1:40-1425(+)
MLAVLTCLAVGAAADGWKYLDRYPPQYVAVKLGDEKITIDGDINEPAWEAVPWTVKPFEDIAAVLYPNLSPPEAYQARVKVRWDAQYMYIAAELNEPLVWGNITGHNDKLTNGKAPWWNNDFEVFIDVSGSTHYYKEFEMNARNATYDVLWRVPDGGMNSIGVPCQAGDPLLWCQNSTFNHNQNWTMYGGTNGMLTAVSVPAALTPFMGKWTAEIAFPIAQGTGHGGLLDADPQHDYSTFDPNRRNLTYWWVNFARAEHPLVTISADPLGIDFFDQDYDAMCAEVQKQYPSLLGTDAWGCYWEFVWNNLGNTQYMHNPEMWGVVQFSSTNAPVCRTTDWPGRYLALQLYRAQVAYYQQHQQYSNDVALLSSMQYCNKSTNCNATDAQAALTTYSNVFKIYVTVDSSSTTCVDYINHKATGAPCFNVTVTTQDPGGAFVKTTSVAADRYTRTSTQSGQEACL